MNLDLISNTFLTKTLQSLHIEDFNIQNMIDQSCSIPGFDNSNIPIVTYTFPLFSSFEYINKSLTDYIFSHQIVIENPKPMAISIDFYMKTINMVSIKSVLFSFSNDKEVLFLEILEDTNTNKCNKVYPLLMNSTNPAFLAIIKKIGLSLFDSFNFDPNVFKTFLLHNGCSLKWGVFDFNHNTERGELTIFGLLSDYISVPKHLLQIMGKKPNSFKFIFTDNYSDLSVIFLYRSYIKISGVDYNVESEIRTDIFGNITSCVKRQCALYNIFEKFEIIFELNLSDLPQADICSIMYIYLNMTEEIKQIVPELLLTGPSNIPNFQERLDLAKMLIV